MPIDSLEPRSLWWRRDGTDTARAPLADAGVTADVCIVGAGIVGATAALLLARAGKEVVVLERDVIGRGATGNSTAKVTALQSPRLAMLERDHGPDAAAGYARMSLDAVDTVRELATPGSAVETATAVTWVASPTAGDRLEAEHDAARRAGLALRLVHGETHGLPSAVALVLDDQLQIDSLGHLRGLVAQAEAAGATFHEDSRVTGVSLSGSVRTVTTAQGGSVTASHVVVASGLPILDRGGWFARTAPKRSYAVALRTEQVPEAMGLRVDGPTRSTRASTAADGTPVAVVAGEDHRTGEGGDTRLRYQALESWGHEQFGHGPPVARWSAQDWSTADGLPLAGPLVPRDQRILAASGFDKWGLTSGTAAAGVLVDRILGRTPDATSRLLDPMRLRLRAAGPTLVSNNAHVGMRMTTGWVGAVATTTDEPEEGEGVVGRDHLRPTAASKVDGEVRSCLAVCPHLGGIVRWEPGDEAWACPLHGSRFAPDGEILSGPTSRPLKRLD